MICKTKTMTMVPTLYPGPPGRRAGKAEATPGRGDRPCPGCFAWKHRCGPSLQSTFTNREWAFV